MVTMVDTLKSPNNILRVCTIDARKLVRICLFRIFVRLKEINTLILIEKTIPSTVNRVCKTIALPFTPALDSRQATIIANTIRIIILPIFLLSYLA